MASDSILLAGLQRVVNPRLLWLPLFVMLSVTVMSSGSGPQTGAVRFHGMDKVGHFVIYGMLSVAWARCFHGRLPEQKACLGAVLITVVFGCSDELHQLFNPVRFFEWADILANTLGAVAGACLYLYWGWLRRLLEWPLQPGSMRPNHPRVNR